MNSHPLPRVGTVFFDTIDLTALQRAIEPLLIDTWSFFSEDSVEIPTEPVTAIATADENGNISFRPPARLDPHEVRFYGGLQTASEKFEPTSASVQGFRGLIESANSLQWRHLRFHIVHCKVTRFSGTALAGAYKGEHFNFKANADEGSCELGCRLKTDEISVEFLDRLIKETGLSFKPQKHSRDIPEWLETELLCESMHLCNKCRSEGVIIHHIKAVEDGGETKKENLIVLCLACHRQAHTKSQLTKNLKPEHLFFYKKHHQQWAAQQGISMPVGHILVATTDGIPADS